MSECYTDSIGNKYWRNYNGQLHREDGPAVELVRGDKYWYFNGDPHRNDGPAFDYPNALPSWWYKGTRIHCDSNEEYLKIIKLKAFW